MLLTREGHLSKRLGHTLWRALRVGGEGCPGLSKNALVWEGGLSPFPLQQAKYCVFAAHLPCSRNGVWTGDPSG